MSHLKRTVETCQNLLQILLELLPVGVSQTNRKNGNNDWVAFINDDQGKKRRKSFACKKYGDQEAKQLAIQQRAIWKQELGYLGE